MESYKDKIAVVTGGGTGMGRELVRLLAKEGCHVAMCDVIKENLEESFALTSKEFPDVLITTHICDVSVEEDVIRFKNEVLEQHETETINLLFNNAGIGGGATPAVEKETSSISSPIIGKDSIRPTVSVSVISPETIGEYISS